MIKPIKLPWIGIFIILVHGQIAGQNTVGIGTPTPNPHAVLELVSPGNNQGLLVPRLTTTQRTSPAFITTLSSQDKGLLVYDSDVDRFFHWDGSAWKTIDAPQDLILNGSTLSITNNPTAIPIDLSTLGANTDDQSIAYDPSTGLFTISGLAGGNSVNITPAGTASGDLSGSYPSPSVANNAISNSKLSDNAVSTAKILDGSVTATKLANTSVTPGVYGTATEVSRITVDAQGRITSASNVTITGAAPTGAAGGDLAGNFPNPTIANTAGNNVVTSINNAATTGTINTNKLNAAVVLDSESPALGDVSGNFTAGLQINANVVSTTEITDGTIATADLANGAVTAGKLANTSVTPGLYGTATEVSQITVDAQGRITSANNVTITGAAPTGAAGGDLAGNFPNPTIANTAGNNVVTSINNAATTGTINTNKLNTAVVLDSESPALGDVSGNFTAGLQINASTVTTTEITDGTIATADLANTSVTDAKIAAGITVSKLNPSVTNGQVLTTIAGASTWANLPPSGTVTNIATGTGLTGGPITTTGTVSLANTSVTPGVYGTATEVSRITVDAQGRITSASNVTITGAAPTGAAGGDLAGNFPNPTIANTAGNNVVTSINNAATTGTINTNKLNTAVVLDSESPALGDVSGNFTAGLQINANAVSTTEITDGTIATADLANTSVTDAKIAAGITVSKLNPSVTNGQVLTTIAGASTWANLPPSGTVTNIATGTGLTGGPITTTGTVSLANTTVAAGVYGTATQVPQFTVDAQGRITNAANTTITGVLPGGAAGGDLNGTFPNPTVDGLQGRAIATTLPADGQVLKWNATATQWQPATDNAGALQNIASVLGQGNNAGGQGIINLNSISINTSATPGALNVIGSQYVGFTTLTTTATYNAQPDDYIIIGSTINSVVGTVVLPDASVSIGRILILRSRSFGVSTTGGIRFQTAAGDTLDGANFSQVLSLQTGSVYSITVIAISNNEWITISKSVL